MVDVFPTVQHVRFLDDQPSQANMWYTREIDLSDLAYAEWNAINPDPACVELLGWMEQEKLARTGGIDWQQACNTVFARGRDRNGFA